jgi:hypothetical protein
VNRAKSPDAISFRAFYREDSNTASDRIRVQRKTLIETNSNSAPLCHPLSRRLKPRDDDTNRYDSPIVMAGVLADKRRSYTLSFCTFCNEAITHCALPRRSPLHGI